MKKAMVFLAALLVICGISLAEDAVTSATLSVDRLPAVESTGSSILVVYFSTDDTIRAAAYTVAEALSADLFEIQPAEPYTTDDVNYHNRQSRTSIEQNDPQARPAIASLPEDLRRYDTVILGYPIWWGQAPRILYSFVESADLSGKTIIPFCTSGFFRCGKQRVQPAETDRREQCLAGGEADQQRQQRGRNPGLGGKPRPGQGGNRHVLYSCQRLGSGCQSRKQFLI